MLCRVYNFLFLSIGVSPVAAPCVQVADSVHQLVLHCLLDEVWFPVVFFSQALQVSLSLALSLLLTSFWFV